MDDNEEESSVHPIPRTSDHGHASSQNINYHHYFVFLNQSFNTFTSVNCYKDWEISDLSLSQVCGLSGHSLRKKDAPGLYFMFHFGIRLMK